MKAIRHIIPLVVLFTGASFTSVCASDQLSPTQISTGKHSTIENLAAKIAGQHAEEYQKARAIYKWVTHNIKIDVDALKNCTPSSSSANETLLTGKATCYGFALLYEELATASELECVVVTGHAKGFDYRPGDSLDTTANHSWNAVNIDGKWRLLDCAWGSGYLDENMQFVARYEDHYFCTSPEDFIYDHFPFDSRWQLLKKPVSKAEYLGLPLCKPAYFVHGLKDLSNKPSTYRSSSTDLIKYRLPGEVSVIAQLLHKGRPVQSETVFVQREKEIAEVHVAFPRNGTYQLRIFAKQLDQPGPYEYAAEYTINVEKETSGPLASFPRAYASFASRGAKLVEPMRGNISPKKTHSFALQVPKAEAVAIVCGGKWTNLARTGDLFKGEAYIGTDDVRVAAKFPGRTEYEVLVGYETD